MDYQLTICTAGETAVRTLTAEPGDLAQAVHRHARGLLGGNCLSVRLDGLTGTAYRGSARVASLTIAEAAAPESPAPWAAGPDEIRHGYTLTDIDRMARTACAADRTYSSDMATRYDIAWSAIATALGTAQEPPRREDLVRTGWQAIYQDVKAVRRLYGVDSTGRSGEVASAPRFAAYWTRIPPVPTSESFIERIALYEILATLWDVELEAVKALAAFDDYQAAADSLDISYKAFIRNLNAARHRFKRRWYAPGNAPTTRTTDRRVGSHGHPLATHCSAGHEWTDENTRWGRGHTTASAKRRYCRACERERARTRRSGAAA